MARQKVSLINRQEMGDDSSEAIRLDKWLWAARFYKNRTLAHEAIDLGRVLLNGQRIKSSRTVKVGDVLDLTIQNFAYRVTVVGVSGQRKSAKDVGSLYLEDEAIKQQRIAQQLLVKAQSASFPRTEGRPSKKDRRDLQKFKGSMF